MSTKKETSFAIPSLNLKNFTLKIIGDTPLICHAWSQKAKLEMLNKMKKKPKTAKEVRRPFVEFADSLYWLSDKPNFDGLTDEQAKEVLNEIIPKSKFGFPTLAFKAAALDAGLQQGALVSKAGTADLAKTTARGAIRVDGEFVTINGIPTIREDIGRLSTSSTDLRYRAEFKSWSTSISIIYNANIITPEIIFNLFTLGGFANGVGDWRPERKGTFGCFHCEL